MSVKNSKNSRHSSNEELTRLHPRRHTIKASPKPAANPIRTTFKNKSRLPAINTTKTQLQRFRQQFENLFTYIDEEQQYEVSDEMIEPYITNPKNNLLDTPKIQDLAMKLYLSHRYLLYLDQFISFIKYLVKNPDNVLQDYSYYHYFDLPIASTVLPQITTKGGNLSDITHRYSAEIYKQLEPINAEYKRASRTITDISLICCHGAYSSDTLTFCRVPDDVIIAIPTPLNRSQSSNFENEFFFEIMEPYRTDPEFLKNPACYLRGDNCLQYTIYYYPGQLIPNIELSYDLSIDWERDSMGFYPNNAQENRRDELFNNVKLTKYSGKLSDLFQNKLELLKNKIIYINCCRSCDSDISNDEIEFLFRYEHIINYMNISNCLEIESKVNNDKCKDSTFWQTSRIPTIKSGTHFFYDPALLSTFKKTHKIHKHKIINKSYLNWQGILDDLNKTSKYNQLGKFTKITNTLIENFDTDPELYSNRLVDLFTKINIKFENYINNYIRNLNDGKFLKLITQKFEKNNILDKLDKILAGLFNIFQGNDKGEYKIYKLIEQVYNDEYVLNYYVNRLQKTLQKISKSEASNVFNGIITHLLFGLIKDKPITIKLPELDKYDARDILTRKIQLLTAFNSDPELTKLINKTPSNESMDFINMVFWCYAQLIIKDGNILIGLYDIYTQNESGGYTYLFSPNSEIDMEMPEESIDDKYLAKIALKEQSPLLYSLCFAADYQDFNYSHELSAKLFDAMLNKYQNSYSLDVQIRFLSIKNKYLHVFIYMLLYGKFSDEFRKVIKDCITKLLEITNLFISNQSSGFNNLYVYLSKLLVKYAGYQKSEIIKDELFDKINPIRPSLDEQRHMKRSDEVELLKQFTTKFETDYNAANTEDETMPKRINKLDIGHRVFDTLFMS